MDKLLLLRHAEKPYHNAGVGGVDESGRPDAASLSVRGWLRAGALVAWLVPACGRAPFGPPAALWAAPHTMKHPSARPLQTLLPMARACRLDIDTTLDEAQPQASAERLMRCEGTVVVCGRHGELPALAAAVVERLNVPGDLVAREWPDDRFDLVWLFERAVADERWNLRVVAQRLLDGDRP